MRKTTLDNPHGAAPSIFWVAADTVSDAATLACRQAGDVTNPPSTARVEHADDIDPAEDRWPRPYLIDGIRVFTFEDSTTAYDQTQIRDDLHDGDVLHVPSENVAGFLLRSWPVALSPERGAFHRLLDPRHAVIDGTDYTPSVRVAETLLAPERPAPPLTPHPPSRNLLPTAGVWTITIAGQERHDGERPYTWVLNAPEATIAAAIAERHHQTSQDDLDTLVYSVEPGAPTAFYPWAYNDLRPLPARTIVLTPAQIRQIAQIRLAGKRLNRHLNDAKTTGHVHTAHDARTAALGGGLADLVRQLIDEFGPGA